MALETESMMKEELEENALKSKTNTQCVKSKVYIDREKWYIMPLLH